MPLPICRATLVAPEPLLQERSFLRLHNRSSKEALRDEAVRHHKQRIPGHFTRSAAGKYKHQPRKPAYIRFKARRFRSVVDLVKTGQARDAMTKTSPAIRIGGQAADESGAASKPLKLTLTLPFHIGQKAQAGYAKKARAAKQGRPTRTRSRSSGVTIAQMRKELGTVTEDEGRDTARGFLKGYGRRLGEGLARAPRIRKRVNAARSFQ